MRCLACFPEDCKRPDIPVWSFRLKGRYTTSGYSCHANSEEEAVKKCRKFFNEEYRITLTQSNFYNDKDTVEDLTKEDKDDDLMLAEGFLKLLKKTKFPSLTTDPSEDTM